MITAGIHPVSQVLVPKQFGYVSAFRQLKHRYRVWCAFATMASRTCRQRSPACTTQAECQTNYIYDNNVFARRFVLYSNF